MKLLTIYVVPSDAVGHINACMGTTRSLLARGHRVIFLTEEAFRGKISCYGFEEHNYKHKFAESDSNNNKSNGGKLKPGEKMARDLLTNKIIGPFPMEEKIGQMVKYFAASNTAKEKLVARDVALKEAISLYDPDVFIVDKGCLEPAIYYSGKPWIWNCSFSPLCGMLNKTDSQEKNPMAMFLKHFRKFFEQSSLFTANIESLGYSKYIEDTQLPQTQILTVYAFPEELNVDEIRERGWFNLELFDLKSIQHEMTSLEECGVPSAFVSDNLNGQFSGKYIYLSLGSMGSVDVDLMQRLVRILSTTNHKYIVSKGPRHEEFDLAPNMWGDAFLPQTQIVPFTDLVITHGGNNTVTETFAIGKPMVVMPMFGDQFVNGMQLEESGLGVYLDPYDFQDSQLLDAVDQLLKDQALNIKLRKAAIRIQSSNSHEVLCDKIEALLKGITN